MSVVATCTLAVVASLHAATCVAQGAASTSATNSRFPDGMECVSYCVDWEATDARNRDKAGGVAKVYQSSWQTWGYLGAVLQDDAQILPGDQGVVARMHTTSCSPPGNASASEASDVVSINGDKFEWWLEPSSDGSGSRPAAPETFEFLVPAPEDGATSVVIHDADGGRYLCCDQRSCAPPCSHECYATCSQWTPLSAADAPFVLGRAELYRTTGDGNGASDAWLLLDVSFDAWDKSAPRWAADITVSVAQATLEEAATGPAAAESTVAEFRVPGRRFTGGQVMSVQTQAGLQLPTHSPATPLSLVLSAPGQPLAVCQMQGCEGRGRACGGQRPVGPSRGPRWHRAVWFPIVAVGAPIVAFFAILCCIRAFLQRRIAAQGRGSGATEEAELVLQRPGREGSLVPVNGYLHHAAEPQTAVADGNWTGGARTDKQLNALDGHLAPGDGALNGHNGTAVHGHSGGVDVMDSKDGDPAGSTPAEPAPGGTDGCAAPSGAQSPSGADPNSIPSAHSQWSMWAAGVQTPFHSASMPIIPLR